jgi:hypothetical protein
MGADLPDGQISDLAVKPLLQKYSDFQNTQISFISTTVPFLPRGRLAIVTDAERDAVDVDAPLTNGVEADGEVVWS